MDILQHSSERDDLNRRLEGHKGKHAAGGRRLSKMWAIQGTCSDDLGMEDEICDFQGGVSEDA
jgi:hypothetical protein